MIIIVGLILLIIGLIPAINPYLGWYLTVGWKFEDAEPSDLALSMERIGGIFISLIGFIMIVATSSMFIGQTIDQNNWIKDFKEQLNPQYVTSITIGYDGEPLNQEKKNEIISLIRNADIYYSKRKSEFFSTNIVIKIDFMDGSSRTIDYRNSEFTIYSYRISSEALARWIQEYMGTQ